MTGYLFENRWTEVLIINYRQFYITLRISSTKVRNSLVFLKKRNLRVIYYTIVIALVIIVISISLVTTISFRFLSLYHNYCQNKATSEAIRKEFIDNTTFFADCQRRAGHPLPLGAYLLKPVQRITKYQLLLRELERHCRPELQGDLRLLGPLRLQSECDIYSFSRKKKGKLSRGQRRHLFLFDGGVLFCKKRSPPSNQPTSLDPEYYEHKMCIPVSVLSFIFSTFCLFLFSDSDSIHILTFKHKVISCHIYVNYRESSLGVFSFRSDYDGNDGTKVSSMVYYLLTYYREITFTFYMTDKFSFISTI
uniref:DH domain-containing protein n=1 Tax=Heterorhabditis bacteriophora TaxID=37862 RepID=A0A1I7X004_HETBA